MSEYKRPGYPTVMPYLTVKGANELLTFIKNVFQGEEIECHRDESGRVAHASIRIGDSTIELSEASEQWGSSPGALHIYVPNCDETYAAAIKAGAEGIYEVADMEYGERSGGVRDASGNKWYIATTL